MIGEEVRRRREELGLTGAQLAAKAGMAPSAVSQIETGKRTPSSASVVKLAEALGVEVGELYPKGSASQRSLAAAELESTLQAARENMALLQSYFDNPPDEETADQAIEAFYELTPRLLEILAGMERADIREFAGKIAELIREYGQVNKRLRAWNEAQYGHRHRDAG